LSAYLPGVGPWQLYGIEINPYAHDLAQMTVWIGWLQWIRANGFGFPADPILRPLSGNIRLMDAIIGEQGVPEWPTVDFIIGNPPFLGGNRIRQELGNDYVERLFSLYDGRVPAFADLCCYWFEKARAHIAAGKCKRAGLLATQGIRGGANREVLKRIKDGGNIFWAESDRPWILDGANVHVSIVGFDNGTEIVHVLDGKPVAAINPNLTSCADITTATIIAANQGICFMGPSPKAPFDIDAKSAAVMLADKGNPNGRPNSDVVRPVMSAVDIGQRPRGKWTIDFALMTFNEAAQYEKPFEYVRTHVYPVRSQNRRASYAAKWWQYAEARPGMRAALQGKHRYIATPGVSKHRLFVWASQEVLCNQGTLVFARDDDAFFGILHSRIHEVWARAQGTQLREAESGCRYTPTTSFETFPLPQASEAIAEAARDLVEKRDRWLNPEGASAAELKQRTLTKLYNARPAWLTVCHARLDAAVAAAYGWPADLTDDAILERLLALNLESSKG
jgi:type II restriction/modification system DNA methylase subunit YeeA